MQIYFIFCLVLISLISISISFTPPDIIYGGWIPILPGHPFYFGSRSAKDKSHLQHYTESQPHYSDPGGHYQPHLHPSDFSSNSHYQAHHHDSEGRHYEYSPYPQDITSNSHLQGQEEHKHVSTSDPSKNPYSYYPHHSSYDKPFHQKHAEVKPVYIEIPRKPHDIYENPRNPASFASPLVQEWGPEDLKAIDHGGEKAYLTISALGKVPHDAVKPTGPIRFNNLHYDAKSIKSPSIQNLMQPSRQLYKNQNTIYYVSSGSSNHNSAHPSVKHEQSNLFQPMNNFRGTDFPVRDHGSNVNEANGFDGGSNYLSHGESGDKKIKPGEKYVSIYDQSATKKETYHPTINQATSYEQPSIYQSANLVNMIGATKPSYAVGGYQYSNLPKNKAGLSKVLKNSLLPKMLGNYFDKSAKVGGLYREPAVLTHIQGTPALVEREVAIVHVPVSQNSEHLVEGTVYHKDDIMYDTASSPPLASLRVSNSLPENRTHGNSLTYGSKYFSQPQSYDDVPSHREKSIFVGTNGLNADDIQKLGDINNLKYKHPNSNGENQHVFHAYYAPSDHLPPPGYQKMSVQEFEKIFKNADIQFMRRKS